MPADPPTPPTPPATADTRGQRGNAMILMPAGFLVMLVLAAIAVDTALLFRSQLELENTAAALANDVAAAVATGSLFDTEASVTIDPDLLDRLARIHEAATGLHDRPHCDVEVTNGPEPTARATCRGTARLIFTSAVPGQDRTVPMHATETSLLDTG